MYSYVGGFPTSQPKLLTLIVLVFSSVLLLLIAGSAAAADETAPTVDVPDDVPGADVIVFYGDSYTFDSSQSTDDSGIVNFMWEFEDGGNPVTLYSTTGKVTYTFANYGQTWVIVTAFDWAGNEGKGYFSIDVAIKVIGDLTIRDQVGLLPYSLYVEDGDVVIDNSTVYMGDGAGSIAGGSGSTAPDQLGESLTPGGDFAGMWQPYYYYQYWANGNQQYGRPYLESNQVFSGDYSIRMSGGSYRYGAEYIFDEPTDLTEWDYFTFWWRSTYSTPYHYILYLYDSEGAYTSYMYIYNYYYGYYAASRGWYGMSYDLNVDTVGYTYSYGMTDMSAVTIIRIYAYCSSGNFYIDHVGFAQQEEPGDPICESASSTGPMGGTWSSSRNTPTTQGSAHVGSGSVGFYLPGSSSYRTTIKYTFNNPVDLSAFHSCRMYTYNGNYYYTYAQGPYVFYVYSATGYGYYYDYPTKYLNYYASYQYGKWDFKSWPWGPQSGLYYNNGVDWTQITAFEIRNIYTYTAGNLLIDGFDWVSLSGGSQLPQDNVPLAIYNAKGDTTIQGGSTFAGIGGETGARLVTMDGDARFQFVTFDNIWTTNTMSAGNGLNVFGGMEVYGDAVIDNVTFKNCLGPGLALFDGKYIIDRDTVDLSDTALKMKMAPKIIMGVTEKTVGQYTMDISGWSLEGSPRGTGILLMFMDTTASIDVTITGNDLDGNGYAGIVISNDGGGLHSSTMVAGTTADLDVTIKDQAIEDSGDYGIIYYAGGGTFDPNIWTTLLIENVTVTKSGEAGLMVWLDMGGTNLDATIVKSTFERNSGYGAMFTFDSFFGECTIDIDDSNFWDNSDSGMVLYGNMGPYNDGQGNVISPVASIDIDINASRFLANRGWGIAENINGWDAPAGGMAPPWTWNGPTWTTLWYNLTMTESEVVENQAGGWLSQPEFGWFYGDKVANHDISDTMFTDNRGNCLVIDPWTDVRGGGSNSDIWMLEEVRMADNSGGIVHDLGTNNYGYYTEVHLQDVDIEDNDGDAIAVTSGSATDGLRRWGTSRVLGAIYYVDGCRIGSPMRWDMIGADDSANPAWDSIMGLQFTNNILTIDDVPIEFYLEAYPTCDDFIAWAEIGDNKYYRGFPGNGIHLEMFGGWNLDMDVNVYNVDIDKPVGAGLNFVAGTLVVTPEPHKLTGTVNVDNVTITDAGSNGINFTVFHKAMTGAKSLGTLEVHDVFMDDVEHGIIANDMIGAVYDTVVLKPRASTVQLRYSYFDFYSCDMGDVDVSNIQVLTKGAARMWYAVGVDVKWASGTRVLGAVVSVQDNTWSIIAVDTVDSDDVLDIGYVNSYTILPDSVFSKSPFMLSGTYLGLSTEKTVDITSNTVVDLILVDDVLPRLTVNLPIDGGSQRETSLVVKGHAWDMHAGLMEVMVSIDYGFTWFEAEGDPDFEYFFDSVPEGNLMLMVKAVDNAGNERIEHISVLVDATAPVIVIIEPKNDIILTQENTLNVIGVTEMGATVLVNNVQVPLEHTLFSTTLVLKEGVNEVRVVALDRLGNSAEHRITVTVDTLVPPLIITSPASGDVVGVRTVHVVGQTEADAMVYVNGKMAANQMGVFSHSVVLEEGPNTIIVTSEDKVGNMATSTIQVTMDTSVPWLQLASPMEGDVFGADGIDVIGWVEEGSAVTINDQEVTVDSAHFSARIIGKEGRNVIEVTVADRAGNEYSRTVVVWYDTTPPEIELWTPNDGLITPEDTVEVTGVLRWNVDRESFRDITLSINGDFAPFAADGEFRIQYDLTEGTNPLFIRATDDVGNSVVTTVTVVRDSVAPFLLVEPTPTFDHPTWNKPSTYNGLVYIEGVTEPGTMVTVADASVEVDGTGHFNVSIVLGQVPKDEELLQHSILVVATDAAGNYREETVEVYRLREVEEDPTFMDYESAQYWVLLLSIIILVVAIVATTFLWKRIGTREEEYDDDLYLEEV